MAVMTSVTDNANMLWSTITAYAASHHDGIVALLLFTGVIISFSGRTLLRPTVFLLGFVPSAITVSALGLALVQDESPSNMSLLECIVLLVGFAVAILVGIVMLRLLFRIATFLLCAGFGAVLVLVSHLFLFEPATDQNALILLYAIMLLAALVAGLFSVSYPDTGIILGTAFDGSAMSVFCLARFLGHRPPVLSTVPVGTQVSTWWSIGYGSAVLILGIFGAMTQRQVAKADAIIAKAAETGAEDENASYAISDHEHLNLLGSVEPPRTPPYMRSGHNSPGNSGYGAVDQEDTQYSVVHNLGAAPLGASMDQYKSGKDFNGPLPL